jgi:hypothetical protein
MAEPALTATGAGFLVADLGSTTITFSATRAAGEAVGTYLITPLATDHATGLLGNYVVTYVPATFTITVTAASLCDLTKRYIESSGKYAALPPQLRAVVNQLASGLCAKAVLPSWLTPTQKAAAIAAFDRAVDDLVRLGWITSAQGTILKNGANWL